MWVHFLEYIISPLFYPFKQATVKSYHVFFFIKLSLKKKHHKEENNKSKIYCSLETFLGSSLCSRQLFEVVSDHWQLSCFYNTVIYFLNILFILGINVINHLMLRWEASVIMASMPSLIWDSNHWLLKLLHFIHVF